MKKVKVNFYVDEEMKAWLQEEASRFGLSVSSFISYVLTTYRESQREK
ncbi:MAG: hypothetical protein H0Z24_10230 [Thermosipho sp. (in: Bacteria)]|nr:hypothetical protein [Thermosipho sp. (in: thermotogales)]